MKTSTTKNKNPICRAQSKIAGGGTDGHRPGILLFHNKKISSGLLMTLAILFWIAVWQVLSVFLDNSLLIASPLAVVKRIAELAATVPFWASIGVSLGRILVGYAIGAAAGLMFGVLGTRFFPIHVLLSPLMAVIKSAPVTSFIILALVWIKSYELSAFIAFLMVFPMVYSSTMEGIRSVDPKLLEVAKVYGFPARKTVKLVYIPALRPFLLSSLSTAIGFAWKAGITGEIFALPKPAIGTMLYNAKIYLETLDGFCWTVVIIGLSLLIEALVKSLVRKI